MRPGVFTFWVAKDRRISDVVYVEVEESALPIIQEREIPITLTSYDAALAQYWLQRERPLTRGEVQFVIDTEDLRRKFAHALEFGA